MILKRSTLIKYSQIEKHMFSIIYAYFKPILLVFIIIYESFNNLNRKSRGFLSRYLSFDMVYIHKYCHQRLSAIILAFL